MVSQQISNDQESQSGSISKPISKPQAGFPPKNPCLLYKLHNKAFLNPNQNTFSKIISKIF
jgi:hypothetical protein